ncbi:MAG: hypothetical protein GY769_04240 [bacterium]|nr:hypothetical protein [bacterium]
MLTLEILGIGICIETEDAEVESLFEATYGAMRRQAPGQDLRYRIGRSDGAEELTLTRNGGAVQTAEDEGELLWLFDGDLAVELQKLRSDLFFLHSAVLNVRGRGCLLVGGIGAGKSTTAWALSHFGGRYSSDELAPVDLGALEVHAYPRALCLKDEPPVPYQLPETTVRTTRAMYVPAGSMPGGMNGRGALSVSSVIVINHEAEASQPRLRRLGKAEAAVRIYPHALNALAHSGQGLDAVIRIASGCACFELTRGELSATCKQIESLLAESADPGFGATTEPPGGG